MLDSMPLVSTFSASSPPQHPRDLRGILWRTLVNISTLQERSDDRQLWSCCGHWNVLQSRTRGPVQRLPLPKTWF
jgi:hypothetical protein